MAKKATKSEPANAMDYSEHDKTYDVFIKFAVWSTAACVAILVAMAFGFFAGGGLIGGTLLFIILMAACWFAL
jgi:hypothetical protein